MKYSFSISAAGWHVKELSSRSPYSFAPPSFEGFALINMKIARKFKNKSFIETKKSFLPSKKDGTSDDYALRFYIGNWLACEGAVLTKPL
jgi:hypothetical protein